MDKNANNALGSLAEAVFVCEALRRGLLVSKPQTGKEVYDFILDNGVKLFKIQVKSTNEARARGGGHGNGYRFQIAKGSRTKTRYETTDFDVLACYVFSQNEWYFLPAEKACQKLSLRISVNSSRVKNNWEIFD